MGEQQSRQHLSFNHLSLSNSSSVRRIQRDVATAKSASSSDSKKPETTGERYRERSRPRRLQVIVPDIAAVSQSLD
jgi:hypothetical protein